jgi:hypothetical protein
MCRILSLVLCFCYSSYCFGQKQTIIDQQVLNSGKLIRLISNSSADENKRYSIEFINRLTNDTLVNYIDSIQHAHCSPPNSIFFINDSVGFFTESGGCYASYDWLFRTTDKGKTWKFIETGSRTSGNSEFCMLSNKTFYMFDEIKGIIIWDVKDGKLIYSLTSDGGISWKINTQKVKANINEIQNISYSADGQVTVVCSEKYLRESERKRVTIIQSNNFGNTFLELK